MDINGKGLVVGHGFSSSGEPEVVIRMLNGDRIIAECRPFFFWGEMVTFKATVLEDERFQDHTDYKCSLKKIEYM